MEPTDSQIGILYKWISWKLPREEAVAATHWIKNNATRKEVSAEVSRVHDLYYHNKLNKETLYDSDIWKGFDHD